jgi:hypothetical protein
LQVGTAAFECCFIDTWLRGKEPYGSCTSSN